MSEPRSRRPPSSLSRSRSPRHLQLRLLLALLVLLLAPSLMARAGKPSRDRDRDRGHDKGKHDKGKHEREREPKGPPSLALESLDLAGAKAVVRVGGAGKAPDARLFVFHDDRERHFVALFAACEEASAVVREGVKVADGSVPSTAAQGGGGESGGEPGRDSGKENGRDSGKDSGRESGRDSGDGALVCELDVPRPYLRAHVVGLTVRLRGRDVPADEHAVTELWSRAQAMTPLASTPPAVPMTSVQVPCDDPGFEWPPRRDKTPNATDEEEVQETEEESTD